mmetsp:Transcript_14042/g.41111  ORF Transcript_14042/g.41111 Transcript_14042/m.41111 type:complete len:200 (+) Transcript_14042:305-904(+)
MTWLHFTGPIPSILSSFVFNVASSNGRASMMRGESILPIPRTSHKSSSVQVLMLRRAGGGLGAADDGGAGANGGCMGATGGGVVTASVGNGSGEATGATRRRVACGGVAAGSRGETRGGELGRGGTGRSCTIAGDGVAKSRMRMRASRMPIKTKKRANQSHRKRSRSWTGGASSGGGGTVCTTAKIILTRSDAAASMSV